MTDLPERDNRPGKLPPLDPGLEEELERLHAAFWEGAPLDDLARALGVDSVTLARLFRNDGMPTTRPDYRGTGKRKAPHRPLSRAERDGRGRQMYAMYEGGATLEQVASRFGVTRERVRQVLRGFDTSTSSFKKRRRQKLERRHQSRLEDHRGAVRSAFEVHGDTAVVAQELGLPERTVATIVKEDPRWARRYKKDGRRKKRYSDTELMACLKEAAAGWEGVLTGAKYDWYARGHTMADGRAWPGKQTFILRYSTWRDALGRAGLPANPPSAITGRGKFDKGRCIGALRHAAAVLGKTPTAAEYERLARDSAGSLPSQATVRNTLGTWTEALMEAEL